MYGYHTTSNSMPSSSSIILKPGSQSYPIFCNPNSPFIYSNSPLRPFKANSVQPEYRFGTPLNDPGLYKLMEDFEAECKRNDSKVGKKELFQNFSSAKVVHHANSMQFQQVIFSTPVQSEFFKTMSAALGVLDSR